MTTTRIIVATLVLSAAVSLSAQTAAFTGVVTNAAGAPLGSMTVQAYNTAGIPVSATTDPQGRYLLIVPVGTHRLVAWDNSGTYAVSFHPNAPSYEHSQPINVVESQVVTVNFRLSSAVHITGRVTNAASGAGMAGAVVAAYNLDGTRKTLVNTNADGSYTLTVPPGSYKVVAYHDVAPFIPVFYSNQQLWDRATVVTPPASNVNFGLGQGVKVVGNVTDRASGQPLANLAVVAYDLQGNVQFRTSTNSAGDFTFVLPLNGLFRVAVEDASGIYASTFYRNAPTFASAVTITADHSTPRLNFAVMRASDEPRTTVFVPGVISGQNAAGIVFKSDVWIVNPNPDPIIVAATLLRSGQDNSTAPAVSVTVPGHGQRYLQDVVQSFFATSGAGALRFESAAPFSATSRTYNVPPNAPVAGTFGLSIPGQTVRESRSRATLAGLVQNANSRSNIGLMNPQSVPVDIRVEIYSANGVLLGAQTFPLAPGEWVQPSAESIAPVQFDEAYAILSSQQDSFFSYAAVVDNKSNDGTIILPVDE